MVQFIKKVMQLWYDIKEVHQVIKEEKKQHQKKSEEYHKAFESILYKYRYEQLLSEYNALVQRINQKGGENFLQNASIQPVGIQLSKEDLKSLVQLCHPDKHAGKESAVEMTKKLNIIRNNME